MPLTGANYLPASGGDHQGLCGRPWMLRGVSHGENTKEIVSSPFIENNGINPPAFGRLDRPRSSGEPPTVRRTIFSVVEQPSGFAATVSYPTSGFARRGGGGRGAARGKSQTTGLVFSLYVVFFRVSTGANRALFSLWLLSLLSKRKRESDTFPRLGSGGKFFLLQKGMQLSDFKFVPLTRAN